MDDVVMKPVRSATVATRVEPELYDKLCDEAYKHDRTLSEYVRLVLLGKIKRIEK